MWWQSEHLEQSISSFLPAVCSICRKLPAEHEPVENICGLCLSQLPLRPPERSFSFMENPSTIGSDLRLPLFTALYYEGAIRQAITGLKFHNRTDFAFLLGDLLAVFWQRQLRYTGNLLEPQELRLDGIVPLPLHTARLRERGYNQTELVCQRLADKLALPIYPNALARTRSTKRQSELSSREERLRNVKGAFRVQDADLSKGQRFLLVDDVTSSGATLWEAAETMLRDGFGVILLAVASNKPVGSIEEV